MRDQIDFGGPKYLFGDQYDFWGSNMSVCRSKMTLGGVKWHLGEYNDICGTKLTSGGPKWLLDVQHVFLETKMTLGIQNDFWVNKMTFKGPNSHIKTLSNKSMSKTFSRVLLLPITTFSRILPLPYHLFHLLQDTLFT